MKYIDLDSFKKEVVENKNLVFLAVETEWCEPCKKMGEIVAQLTSQLKDEGISYMALNLDKNPSFTAYYHMKGLPTVMIFYKGVLKQTIMGVKTVQEYAQAINSILHPTMDEKKEVTQKKVKVFSTPTCPYCHMAKAYLKEKGIAFDDIDVSKDQAQAMAMVQKSGQMGVPQLWIDEEVVVGFDQQKINTLLGI